MELLAKAKPQTPNKWSLRLESHTSVSFGRSTGVYFNLEGAMIIHRPDGSPLVTVHPVVLTALITEVGTLLNHLIR